MNPLLAEGVVARVMRDELVAHYQQRACQVVDALNAARIQRDATTSMALMSIAVTGIHRRCPGVTAEEVTEIVLQMFAEAKANADKREAEEE